jgi:capsular exopolysaccharide synthesis family protein
MEDEINLGQYVSVLIKWHRLIILAALLAGLVAFGVSSTLPPTYEAETAVTLVKSSTQLNFDPKMTTVSDMNAGYYVDQDARRKALTTLVKSSDVATAVIAKIGDQLSAAEHIPANLVGAINGTNNGDVIKITARADRADKAALLANTWTQEYLNNVNTIYSETPLSSAELQLQADAAKRDYDQKETTLVAYVANNPNDKLTRQIAEKQQVINSLQSGNAPDKTKSYLDSIINARLAVFNQQSAAKTQKLADLYSIRNRLERLLADAQALRNQLSAGAVSNSRGDELAGLLLEASAFSTGTDLPVSLQIPMDRFSTGATAAEQLRSLDRLIATLEARGKVVQAEIDAQSKELLMTSGVEFLSTQQQGLDKVIGYPSANEPITKVVDQLQQEVNQLQSQLEQESAKKQELVRSRELAWSTYTTLSNKAAEATVAAQSKGSVIRLAVPAVAPHAPISPNKTTNTLLASVVGLVLAVGVAFLFEYLNNTLSSAEQVGTLLKLPALGAIPASTNDHALVVASEPRSTSAEAYRLLQYSVGMNNAWKVLLVTSALPSEGKSTVAANLAVLMAQAGKKVTLVDANFRHPTQHEIFGLKNSVGLADLLNHAPDDWGADCQATGVDGLSVLPSGPLPPDPVRLLENSKLKDLVERLKAASDIVVIDAPATLGLVDTFVTARVADALLFVVERGRVSRQDALQAKETLAASGVPMIGFVLNRATELPRAQTYAYYAHPDGTPRSSQTWWSAARARLAALLSLQ